MSGGLAISLATKGRVHCRRGPAVVNTLVPSISARSIEPAINTEGIAPPEYELIVPDLSPEAAAAATSPPEFEVSPAVDPVPDANTEACSDTPETKIRPVEDLRPTIVKKDDC